MLGAFLGVSRIIVHVVFLSDDDDAPIESPETSPAPPPLQKRNLQNMKGRNFATSKIAPAKQEEKWQKLVNFQSEMDGSSMPCKVLRKSKRTTSGIPTWSPTVVLT